MIYTLIPLSDAGVNTVDWEEYYDTYQLADARLRLTAVDSWTDLTIKSSIVLTSKDDQINHIAELRRIHGNDVTIFISKEGEPSGDTNVSDLENIEDVFLKSLITRCLEVIPDAISITWNYSTVEGYKVQWLVC